MVGCLRARYCDWAEELGRPEPRSMGGFSGLRSCCQQSSAQACNSATRKPARQSKSTEDKVPGAKHQSPEENESKPAAPNSESCSGCAILRSCRRQRCCEVQPTAEVAHLVTPAR